METTETNSNSSLMTPPVLPNGNGNFTTCSELLTEEELIRFLRIPEITYSNNHHNVIENLKRRRDLPRMYICGKTLYPIQAVREWIMEQTTNGK